MLPGFFAGLAATVAVSLVTEPPEGAEEEFEDVHHEVGHPFRRPQEQLREAVGGGSSPPTY